MERGVVVLGMLEVLPLYTHAGGLEMERALDAIDNDNGSDEAVTIPLLVWGVLPIMP